MVLSQTLPTENREEEPVVTDDWKLLKQSYPVLKNL